jgi:hypothetical protein
VESIDGGQRSALVLPEVYSHELDVVVHGPEVVGDVQHCLQCCKLLQQLALPHWHPQWFAQGAEVAVPLAEAQLQVLAQTHLT